MATNYGLMDFDTVYHEEDFMTASEKKIVEALEIMGWAQKDIAEGLDKIAESIDGLARIIDRGLTAIVDERRAARLSNEYYLLCDRMVQLKEKHPDLSFAIDKNKIADRMIQLSSEMMITLGYLFDKSGDDVFQRFTLECEMGGCKPEEWLLSFCRRAREARPDSPIEWAGYKLRMHSSNFQCEIFKIDGELRYPTRLTPQLVERITKIVSSEYGKGDGLLRIAEGYSKLSAWVTEQNCKNLIGYLKEVYSDVVMQYLMS